jgi:hypothetical protein
VSKFTASGTIGNSQIFDNGTNVGIGTATPTNGKFQIDAGTSVPVVALTTNSDVARYFSSVTYAGFRVIAPINTGVPYIGLNTSSSIGTYDVGNQKAFFAYWSDNSGYASLGYGSTSHAIVYRVNNGNVIIGGGTTDAGYKLDVNGTTRISGTELRLDNGTTGVINLYSATPEIRFSVGDPTGYRIYRSSTNMIINSGGGIIQQIGGNQAYTLDASNGHIFRTALSGGAGLMRLDTGGSLSIGKGTAAAVSSSIVELSSTTKGFLPPRMTGAQAEAITGPAAGLMVYSTDGSGATITSLGWWGFNGTTWVKLN